MNLPDTWINSNTFEESVNSVTNAFPYRAQLSDLHLFSDKSFPWHWHNEVEIFYMREGSMEYHLTSGVHTFHKGEAGFLNANVLHMTRIPENEPSLEEYHIFLPSFIAGQAGSTIDLKYVQPVLHNGAPDILRLDADVIPLMRQAFDLQAEAAPGFELKIRNILSMLWLKVLSAMQAIHREQPTHSLDDSRIKRMLSYIDDHYGSRISLKDIATAGLIGERECFRIFQRCLNLTPITYLTQYRISKACERLRTTDESILEIALACGFCGSSYFGKVFRTHTGVTPMAYRKG